VAIGYRGALVIGTMTMAKNCSKLLFTIFLIASSSNFALAQQSASVAIGGNIASSAELEAAPPVSSDNSINVVVQNVISDTIQLQISAPAGLRNGRIVIPLRLRTNMSRFRLLAKPNTNLLGLTISTGMPRASGTGAMLVPGTIESFVNSNTQLQSEALIASGSRISRRGNNRSPDNAIETELVLSADSLGATCRDTCSIMIFMQQM
jgi:hypothetical protein